MLAPEFDLFAKPEIPAAAVPKPPSPEVRARLARLRDEAVSSASHGRYVDAASREWAGLPSNWRMTLLMLGGAGVDVEDLNALVRRSWAELPPPEREAVQGAVRLAKRHLVQLVALAARS